MHYYQHNIGDYRRDTVHLSLLEHGIYRQLLDIYYLSETPIPKETQQVYRKLTAKTVDEQKAVDIILSEFFLLSHEGWIHKRCDMEIANYHHKVVISRTNGKKGGRPPKPIPEPEKTQQVNLGNPAPKQSEPERINALTNKPINLLKPLKAIDRNSDEFDRFWTAYPKKVGKLEAAKAWSKKKPDIQIVLQTLEWQIKSRQWKEGYVPNPATYLNQGRWQDSPSNERPSKLDNLHEINKRAVDGWMPPEMRNVR
jgi:uncharacterized protein YdaU (DUF1376 family)